MDFLVWTLIIVFFCGPFVLGLGLVVFLMFTDSKEMGLFESPKDWGVNDYDHRKR